MRTLSDILNGKMELDPSNRILRLEVMFPERDIMLDGLRGAIDKGYEVAARTLARGMVRHANVLLTKKEGKC